MVQPPLLSLGKKTTVVPPFYVYKPLELNIDLVAPTSAVVVLTKLPDTGKGLSREV